MQNVGCNVGTGIQGKKQLETWWWSSPLRLDNTDFNTPPIYHPPIFHSSLWSIIFQNRTLNAECLSHHCGCHRFPLFKLLFLFLLLTQPILSPPQSQSHSNFQKTAAACKSLSTQLRQVINDLKSWTKETRGILGCTEPWQEKIQTITTTRRKWLDCQSLNCQLLSLEVPSGISSILQRSILSIHGWRRHHRGFRLHYWIFREQYVSLPINLLFFYLISFRFRSSIHLHRNICNFCLWWGGNKIGILKFKSNLLAYCNCLPSISLTEWRSCNIILSCRNCRRQHVCNYIDKPADTICTVRRNILHPRKMPWSECSCRSN